MMDFRATKNSLLYHARHPVVLTGIFAVFWSLLWLDAQIWFRLQPWHHALGFLTAIPICLYWIRRTNQKDIPSKAPSAQHPSRSPAPAGSRPCGWLSRFSSTPEQPLNTQSFHKIPRSPLAHRAALSISFIPVWQFAAHLPLLFSRYELASSLSDAGTFIAFFIGLGWAVWWIDRETKRASDSPDKPRVWDPRRLTAWYFGRKNPKLRQSVFTLLSYSFIFGFLLLILTKLNGCAIYEAPVGGGEIQQLRQIVRIQKVVNKKYVINPYSSVLFNPPPIDDVELQVLEVTEHLYQIGQGKADGDGYSAGTTRGKVRFIRLKYDGGDWDQDMARGSDLNLLTEYGVRLGHKVSDRPEPMEIRRLKSFPARKSPPMVYMTGQQGINVSDAEIKILREYLLEKRGMLFADNGGSSGWEGHFVGMMRKVLPKVEPISVYLDHPIHRIPYPLPKLPIVAPHGRSNALGWVVDGRLVVYYHPGDIGDAWADGHSGVPREIWESCYQLGVNVIYYAHAQYNQWLESTEP